MDVKEMLREVIDPELGVNIVDLGLVYGASVEGKKARVKMTLTTPMCPLGGLMLSSVEEKLRGHGLEPEIDLVFEPPWTPDRMAPELRKRLGL